MFGQGSFQVSNSSISHSYAFSNSVTIATSNGISMIKRETYQLQYFKSYYCHVNYPIPIRSPIRTPIKLPNQTPIKSNEETFKTKEAAPINTIEETPINTLEEIPMNSLFEYSSPNDL